MGIFVLIEVAEEALPVMKDLVFPFVFGTASLVYRELNGREGHDSLRPVL